MKIIVVYELISAWRSHWDIGELFCCRRKSRIWSSNTHCSRILHMMCIDKVLLVPGDTSYCFPIFIALIVLAIHTFAVLWTEDIRSKALTVFLQALGSLAVAPLHVLTHKRAFCYLNWDVKRMDFIHDMIRQRYWHATHSLTCFSHDYCIKPLTHGMGSESMIINC